MTFKLASILYPSSTLALSLLSSFTITGHSVQAATVPEPSTGTFTSEPIAPMTDSSIAASPVPASPATENSSSLTPPPEAPLLTQPAVVALEPVLANPGMAQVNSVSQLSDVQPSDWAYEALRSLVERYGCISSYPDGTFRGNRALTRYEFAAGINACLDRVNQILASNPAGAASREDLDTLNRLQQEFAAELATLRGRVDALEARTTELESEQFSTTTRLFGQVIFGIQGRTENDADFFPVDGVEDTEDPGTQINFISNVQLSLFTQLSPRSLLLTGLVAGTGSTTPRLTNDTRLGYESDTDGDVVLSDLTFRHLVTDNFAFIIGTEGVNMVNVFRGANRVESAGQGPLSVFAQRNPIQNIGAGRGGVGFDWQIASRLSLQAVYSAANPSSLESRAGLFDGRTTTGVQLTYAPTNTIDLAFNYVNAYSPDGFLPTGVGDDQLTAGEPLKTDAFGGTVAWRINPTITVGGWFGYTTSRIPGESGRVETVNWMTFLNFPDLFGRGNLGSIYVGQPPRITRSDLTPGQNIPDLLAGGFGEEGDQPGTTTHVEAFYRWRLSDNITLTPGFVLIFNPGNTPDSDTILIGALRTTFTF